MNDQVTIESRISGPIDEVAQLRRFYQAYVQSTMARSMNRMCETMAEFNDASALLGFYYSEKQKLAEAQTKDVAQQGGME